jgi:hypothetical protein
MGGNLFESAVAAWGGKRAPDHGLLNATNTLVGALLAAAIFFFLRR